MSKIYRHYKGNLYEYIGECLHSETLEEMVIYKALYGEGKTWVRPKTMFFEKVTLKDGTIVPRFAPVETNPTLHIKTFQQLTTDELYELLRVRNDVFVVEQNCVYQDLDYDDQQAIHLWLTEGDKVLALARICPAGTHMSEISIGRVITTERGKGYGKQIMLHAIDAAVEQLHAKQIDIEAQEYAKGFYQSLGFVQSSSPFMLDGIPHIKMTIKI